MSAIFYHLTLHVITVLFVLSRTITNVLISTSVPFFVGGTTKELFAVMSFRLHPRIFSPTCARIMVLELAIRKLTVAFGSRLTVDVRRS